jgi:hypothetical protein
MMELLGLVLDVVILVCLALTIFYALKLSKSLNNFRSYRADFEHLLDELTRNMEDAQRAIHNLRIASGDAGKNLQKILNESKSMADELQIINESANKQAERLEKLLGNASKRTATGKAYDEDVFKERPVTKKPKETILPSSTFSIQDRDFGSAEEDSWEDEGEALPDELQSQAERELYKALQKNKGKASGRAS